jgi:hypothetical protein
MDVREKLVELIFKSLCRHIHKSCKLAENIADDLITDGVTVQEWISVKDRLPEPETDVIAFVGDYIDILSYRYDRRGNLAFMFMDDSGWWHERIRPSVTHWCAMPQPPKGE